MVRVNPGTQEKLVVNELTPESRAGLLDGYVQMVITTPLTQLCHSMIDLALKARSDPGSNTVEQHFLDPRLILPEIA